MKKLLYSTACLFISLQLTAQKNPGNNTLLWRISGKDLKKPSYLFGTMHVTDKRVFQLGDSLIKALEQTEAFAAELDMNRVGMQLVNHMMREQEEKNAQEPEKVKDKLSPELWDRYKDALAKKFDKKAEKITVDELEFIESDLNNDLISKGDMPSFLDAWLFGNARRMGKWVGGVEDFQDQLEHIRGDVEDKIQVALYDDDYYRRSLEWMIKIYTSEKLDSIDALLYREEKTGKKDYIMVRRNLKMARRMDSLSAIRSTLFAVGAAHLPGDSGVVALLRSRGFEVTPVYSSRKINGQKYKPEKVDQSWSNILAADSSYTVQMPGVPENFEYLSSLGLDMQMLYDIAFMKMYMTFGVPLGIERKKLGADSIYNSMKNRYAENGKVLHEKNITVNGNEGREYRFNMPQGEMLMQVFIPESERIIMNAVMALNGKSLKDEETSKFFQSYTYHGNAVSIKENTTWNLLEYPSQAFSVEMPLKPKETKDVVSEEGKINYTWQAVDVINQIWYGVNFSALKQGMHDELGDSAYFMAVKENLEQGFQDGKLLDSTFLTIENNPAFKFKVGGKTEGEYVEMDILILKRAGLTYYLYTVYQDQVKGKQQSEKFINSFRLLPLQTMPVKTVADPGKNFSTSSAYDIREAEAEDLPSCTRRVVKYDPGTALSIFIDRTKFPSWFWYENDTIFLRKRVGLFAGGLDTLINYSVREEGSMKIAEFTVERTGSSDFKKVKFVLNGDEFYEIFGYFRPQDVDRYRSFYDDFKILNPVASKPKGKADDLVNWLRNAGEKEIELVNSLWDDLDFTQEDIPALQKIALKIYPDFDSSYYGNLNTKIFNKIKELDSTHSTVQFIREQYDMISKADEFVKPLIFSYLANVATRESFAVLKDCLFKQPLSLPEMTYSPFYLTDSLELTATLYPDLMKLASTACVWDVVATATARLSDSSMLANSEIKKFGKYFIEQAKTVLAQPKQDVEDRAYLYNDLVQVLGIIGSPEAIAMLNKFSKFNDRQLRFHTLIALLKANQPGDSKTIYTLAITDEFRIHLFDALKKIGKLKLFPVEFLSQRKLGLSKLFNVIDEEEIEPNISHHGEKTILYKGRQQKFQLYKVNYGENENYLGVAGPFALDSKDVASNHEATGVHWDENFDPAKIDKLLTGYLESLEPEKEN